MARSPYSRPVGFAGWLSRTAHVRAVIARLSAAMSRSKRTRCERHEDRREPVRADEQRMIEPAGRRHDHFTVGSRARAEREMQRGHRARRENDVVRS